MTAWRKRCQPEDTPLLALPLLGVDSRGRYFGRPCDESVTASVAGCCVVAACGKDAVPKSWFGTCSNVTTEKHSKCSKKSTQRSQIVQETGACALPNPARSPRTACPTSCVEAHHHRSHRTLSLRARRLHACQICAPRLQHELDHQHSPDSSTR
eukprot:6037433-Prymnesium_polylepis.2